MSWHRNWTTLSLEETYGGNLVFCTASLAVFETIEKEGLVDKGKKLGEEARLGFEKDLILLSCGNFGNVIRTLMPISIERVQLEKGLAILDACFSELAS